MMPGMQRPGTLSEQNPQAPARRDRSKAPEVAFDKRNPQAQCTKTISLRVFKERIGLNLSKQNAASRRIS